MKKTLLIISLLLLLVIGGCSSKSGNVATGKSIKTVTIDNVTATLSNDSGQLKQGQQDISLAFTDSAGKPVDVGAASLNFHMPAMGSMAAMNDPVTLTTTNQPGVYAGKVNISMAGEWQAQLAFEGAAGKGKTTFSVSAR